MLRLLKLTAAVCLLFAATQTVSADTVTFTDRNAFLAAITPTRTLTFDTDPNTNTTFVDSATFQGVLFTGNGSGVGTRFDLQGANVLPSPSDPLSGGALGIRNATSNVPVATIISSTSFNAVGFNFLSPPATGRLQITFGQCLGNSGQACTVFGGFTLLGSDASAGFRGFTLDQQFNQQYNAIFLERIGAGAQRLFIDDLTFGTAQASAVPEPASLILLGTGIAGAVIRKRRAK